MQNVVKVELRVDESGRSRNVIKLTCAVTLKLLVFDSWREAKAGLLYPFPNPAANGPKLTANVAKTYNIRNIH
jgi:hypothetical protein